MQLKNHLISFLFIFLVSIASCKNHKDATKSAEATSQSENDAKAQSAPQGVVDSAAVLPDSLKADNYRLIVVFFSIGMGTDGPNLLKFEESIGEYSKEIGKNFDYERTNWGREGETDFCLRLNELSSSQQAEFVARTRELLKTAKWVNIYENKPCQHKRKR